MGQKTSTAAQNDRFTGVLPLSQRSKRSSGGDVDLRPESPASARPSETTAVPTIEPPPHALIGASTAAAAGLESSRFQDRGESATAAGFSVPESVRKSRTLERFEHTCSEIIPQLLYVSNLQVAQDRNHLSARGISHVVNCCQEVACAAETDEDAPTTYLQLALRDGVQEDLVPFIPQVIEFIEVCRVHGGRVLIHCHQGVSRSCAFAIAYVMYRERRGFHHATAIVKTKRAICSPNAAFICQLLEWESTLESTATAGGGISRNCGLYRLTPHAVYDPTTLVLTLCYQLNTRRKAVVPETSDANPVPTELLWSRGLFVFVDHRQRIVIWKGPKCSLPNAVEQAKTHLRRLLQVLAGEAATANETPVVVVEDDSPEWEGADHFEYATELAWLDAATPAAEPVVAAPPLETHQIAACVSSEEPAQVKPALYLLETHSDGASAAWEPLTNYDSDDLQASDVLLLVAADRAFLWIGSDHQGRDPVGLQALAMEKLDSSSSKTQSNLHVERPGTESETFWNSFEAGY